MNKIEAFIVGTVENKGVERWTIRGRACDDIRVGDVSMQRVFFKQVI